MSNTTAIEFKLAGGAAAQILGLMNAIHVQQKTRRPFLIKYFPHSTGTYWPFAINFLLREGELVDDKASIKGFEPDLDLPVGKIIRDHPLETKIFSYERLLKWIRALGLEFILKRLRGEIALEALPDRLRMVSDRIVKVSGGYVPMLDHEVMKEMDSRFRVGKNANSPFSKSLDIKERYVALHYRIGDKRAKFTHDKDFGGDGIFDPARFKEIIEGLGIAKDHKIYVVSDEPVVAQHLLRQVGIEAHLFENVHDIWADLFYLSQSKSLIGSWSQVSQLAALCVSHNGGRAFLPESTQVGTRANWSIPNTKFFVPRYLDSDHPVYRADFALDEHAHKGYS